METDRISFDIQLDIRITYYVFRNCWHCFKDIFDADFPDYYQADSFLVPVMQHDIVHQKS